MFRGVKEVPDENDCVALNEIWALKMNTFENVYRTMYITQEKFDLFQELARRPDEGEKTI